MPALRSFEFAIIRVVPRVEREEFVNAGVIVFCLAQKFLGSLVQVDEARLKALWPELDVRMVREHLEAFPEVCAGSAGSGPIAAMPIRDRFHWLVSPRSTVIQISPVHSGLCGSPQAEVTRLFRELVCSNIES